MKLLDKIKVKFFKVKAPEIQIPYKIAQTTIDFEHLKKEVIVERDRADRISEETLKGILTEDLRKAVLPYVNMRVEPINTEQYRISFDLFVGKRDL